MRFYRFIQIEDGLHEKILFMGLEGDVYHVETAHLCPSNKTTDKQDLPLECHNDLMSEGGAILLMRYLALTNFIGTFVMKDIGIKGDIGIAEYVNI